MGINKRGIFRFLFTRKSTSNIWDVYVQSMESEEEKGNKSEEKIRRVKDSIKEQIRSPYLKNKTNDCSG